MNPHPRSSTVVLAFFLLAAATATAGDKYLTPCEQSGGLQTPRYAETISWCEELAARSPLINMGFFGVSPQGRPLPVMVADLQGRFSPSDHSDRGEQTVVMVQACIHAGETCGKDAGMSLLRDLAEDPRLAGELLTGTTIVFIPIFNVDGHVQFGPYNRVNQTGPTEMGWRTTAANQNLNRDYLKADTAEMRAWLGLFNQWEPDLFIDIHSTDGADYQYALTYQLEVHGNMEAGLTDWTVAFGEGMEAAMADDGFPIAPYVSFKDWHDPRSGMEAGVMSPRFSQGYTAVRNRPGLLIETHMLKDYPPRVAAARQMLVHALEWLGDKGPQLRQVVRHADQYTASGAFRAEPFPLTFASTGQSRPFTFLGVAYEKTISSITGGEWFHYHADQPETMTIQFFDSVAPEETAMLPEAYIVPPEWSVIIERLAAHGVAFHELTEPVDLEIRSWKFSEAQWRERPYEGHHPVSFQVTPLRETRTFPAGSVVVDLNQPLARVAAHLLEPKGPDSMVSWGYLDSVFEQVEYIESYVIEGMIEKMVAENPDLLRQLEEIKAGDKDFAANPWAIRNWFYRQTPYYDQRIGVYPVGLVDDREVLNRLQTK